MFKNLSKLFLFILIPSLAFFLLFCNCMGFSFEFSANLQIDASHLLGDRGGSHLPDLGFHLTLEAWQVGVILGVIVVCVVLICVLVRFKHKKAKELMAEINEERDQKGTSEKGQKIKGDNNANGGNNVKGEIEAKDVIEISERGSGASEIDKGNKEKQKDKKDINFEELENKQIGKVETRHFEVDEE